MYLFINKKEKSDILEAIMSHVITSDKLLETLSRTCI